MNQVNIADAQRPTEPAKSKPKLALYWATSCGGCEIAVLDIEERILDVAEHFDIVFWPVALDFKTKDVEAMPDGGITVCLFNGAIRTDDNEYMAKLLRQKSKLLVAFGSCAHEGGIPALANTTNRRETFDFIYHESPSTVNPNNAEPETETEVNGFRLKLPAFWDTVRTLDQVVNVDYYIPGCPPQAHQIWSVLETVIDVLENGKPLPPKGAILGAGVKTCCDECPHTREEKKIRRFFRPFEIIPNPGQCRMALPLPTIVLPCGYVFPSSARSSSRGRCMSG